MLANPQPPQIHLPKRWQDCVKLAVLHAIALAHSAIVYARAWAADSINARVRLAAENDRLHEVCALLREEIRIKDTRIVQIMSGMSTSRPFRHRWAFEYRGCRSHYPSAGRFVGGWRWSSTTTRDA
jgi:hypothetical protein